MNELKHRMAAVYKVYCTYARAEDFCNDLAIRRWQTEIHKANLANQVSEGEISQPLDYQQLIPRQAHCDPQNIQIAPLAVRRSNVSVSQYVGAKYCSWKVAFMVELKMFPRYV